MSLVEVNDINYVEEKLIPPLLRTPIRLDWLKTLTAPIQKKYNDIYSIESFVRSFSVSKWSVLTAYTVGVRVRYGVAVWECLIANTGVDPTSDTVTWFQIAQDFVGVDERIKFSSQHMVFQYVLNRYLNTTAYTVPKIYTLTNTIDTNGFYLGTDGDGSFGELGDNTGSVTNQNDFLGTSYSLNQYAFTVYVPAALFLTLGNSTANREQTVRNVVDKYRLAGITYSVTTY